MAMQDTQYGQIGYKGYKITVVQIGTVEYRSKVYDSDMVQVFVDIRRSRFLAECSAKNEVDRRESRKK